MPNTPYFEKLIVQSKNAALNFSLLGNENLFTIRNKPYNGIFVGVFFLLIILPMLLLNKNSTIAAYFFVGITTVLLLLAVWFLGTNDVVFDNLSKIATIKNNNILGQFIKPVKVIHYKDVTDFSFKKVNVSARGFVGFKHKIYLHHSNKTTMILELPYSEKYNVEPQAFIDNLKNLMA
jgi:hypothetical protein